MKLDDFGATSNYEVTNAPEWILEQTRSLAVDDLFDARSWLLTGTSIFPKNFSMFFNAYKLEYEHDNIQRCTELLSEMFQLFPDEPIVWSEIESIITCNGDYDNLTRKQNIFESIPPYLQQKMIISCAERQTDFALRCKMTLVLLRKYPEGIIQYGIPLTERLVDEEKLHSGGTPLNPHRKLLVCELLPVICKTLIAGVSHKHFYKWLQKAAEFYAVYFTTDSKLIPPAVEKPDLSWDDLHALLKYISAQCEWNLAVEQVTSLYDRMNIVKEMYRKSRTDLAGKINKKQVFYTAVSLLIEAAIKYMELLQPYIYNDQKGGHKQAHIVMADWRIGISGSKNHTGCVTASDKLREHFHVAKDAWIILHSNESFDKDFSHLYRRWKMDRWMWLQLFLADHFAYEGDHHSSLTRLNRIMEQDVSRFRHPVLLHCICQLVSSYFASNQLLMACRSVVECLGHMPQSAFMKSPDTIIRDGKSLGVLSEKPGSGRLVLTPLNFSNLLPFWIHILIKSLVKIVGAANDDNVIGHLIVLCQYAWPEWQDECKQALDRISSKNKFCYPIFFHYVISIDILEEIAFLHHNTSSCELFLLPDAPVHGQRMTRGTNKVASEDFKRAMKRQMKKSDDCVETLLRQFLMEQQDYILNSLQTQSSQEILEPMDVNV